MAIQCFIQQGNILFGARKPSSICQIPSNRTLSAETFETWWSRTFALHTVVVAQASALKHSFRCVRSKDEARAERSH